ncbi:MAG: helix-turn-helix domain-containing protein [Acidobacteriota bacterium]|nr:helix-turn-helix domain-containing protein [Acidobacteriota bacterium]
MLRSRRGWTQEELARAAGTQQSALSSYESGKLPLSRSKLESLVAAMGLSPQAIDLTLLWSSAVLPSIEPALMPIDPTAEDQVRFHAKVLAAATAAGDSTREVVLQSHREERARADRKEAANLWAELKACPVRERRIRVEQGVRYRSWALCERICAESAKAAAHDAGQALGLAELALRIAELGPGSEGWLTHLQGYVWVFMGNARRIGSDLPGAAEAFVRAWKLWRSESFGESDPLHEWRLLDLEASLKRDQREFPEALSLLERALGLSREPQDRARILLKVGFTLEQMGDCEQAIAVLEEAGGLVDVFDEPRLLCVLKFNLVVNLHHLSRHREAEPLLAEVRELALKLGNNFDLLRVCWLEGRIAAGLGRRTEAIEALSRVRHEFADRGVAYDMALVTLELSVLYLEEGRASEVRTLARQMAPVFRSQGVHREALAALQVFSQVAVQPEKIDIELVRRLVRYLERARHDPDLRFLAAG